MNEKKFLFYLDKIEKMFPSRQKLNQGEMLKCINKSRATFNRIIDANELNKIPKISLKEEHKRSSSHYYTYQFDIYDIAIFLAQ